MSTNKYFCIMHGLRGCYMPDGEPAVIRVTSRRALKEAIADEANMIATDSTIGFSKRAIASFANECWQEAWRKNPAYLPYCLPCKERGQRDYSYGIFCSVASRKDWEEYNESNDTL